MRILIDARLYGLEHGGPGRYVMNLLKEIEAHDIKNEYIILLRKRYFDQLNFPSHWSKILADFRHYSLFEQLRLPILINQLKPDLVHFPHFNVPLAFKGKFVVTIHDIIMHKFTGTEATTLPAPLYFLKRIGYGKVFKKAVFDSKKIIVPSNFVKTELVNYYKISPEKVVVTYEGVN
jgi:glycosyltransferase involved in cell wall biosynthesis